MGYAAIKAHWLDIGGKEPYATDTVDMFQEGTIFPGVKLVSRGKIVRDVYRMALANSRVPKAVAGDINAELVGVRAGAEGFLRLMRRYGLESFRTSVERMFDHGEAVVRSFIERIPDGRYVGRGTLDSDGVDDELVEFDVAVVVDGSSVVIDYSDAPDPAARPGEQRAAEDGLRNAGRSDDARRRGRVAERGPLPADRGGDAARLALPSAAAGADFIGGWSAIGAIDAIYRAFGEAVPESVPASSGGDICSLVWWGRRATASRGRTGRRTRSARGRLPAVTAPTRSCTSRSRPPGSRRPRSARAATPGSSSRRSSHCDSGGAGRYRGGAGLDLRIRLLEDAEFTSVVDRTRVSPAGLAGGRAARPNGAALVRPDGTRIPCSKATRRAGPGGKRARAPDRRRRRLRRAGAA